MYNEFRRTDMKNLKKMLVLCSLALVFTAVLADASYAESVMETGMKKLWFCSSTLKPLFS